MSFVHGKGTYVRLSDLAAALQDLSAYLDTSKYGAKTDRPETQAFGDLGKRHSVTGLREATLSLTGYHQHAASAKIHGKATNLLFDQYPLRAFLMKGSLKRSIDVPETQAFGNGWKMRGVLGLVAGEGSYEGYFDSSANAVDAVFRAQLAQDPPGPIVHTIGPNGFAIGRTVDLLQIVQGSYDINSDVNGVVGVSASFMADDLVDAGVSLHDLVAETATGNFASVDAGASSPGGGVGHLHVTAFTGTDVTIKIQHSTDNSAWSDLITFTTVAGVTKQRSTVAGTVNRYLRAIISAGTFTTVTFVVAFARRGYTTATAGTHLHLAGLLTVAAEPTFEYGPEGSASGKRKLSGSIRMTTYGVDFDENGTTKWSAEFVNHGEIAEGTF